MRITMLVPVNWQASLLENVTVLYGGLPNSNLKSRRPVDQVLKEEITHYRFA